MIITNNALAMGALALSALTPALLYIGIAVAALGVIVAGLVGIISLVYNRKHATPTYFESRLQEGMMRMHPQADTADLDEETSAQQDEQVDETATSDDTAIVEVEDDVITPYGYTEDVIDGSVQEDAVTEDAATEQQSEDATATAETVVQENVQQDEAVVQEDVAVTKDAAQQIADQADVSTDAATDDTVTQADAVRVDTQDDVATDARQAQDAAQTDAAAPKEQVTGPVQETRTAAGSDEVSARDVADTQAKSRPKTAQDTKALFDVIVGSESEWEAQTAQEVADMDVQVSDPEDEMLTRMVSNDNGDLDNFDFDSDFGDFDLFKAETQSATDDVERLALLNAFVQQEGEDEWDNDEVADAEEAAEEAEAIEEETSDETAAAMGLDGVFRSRYTRTFRAKLRQSSDEVKAYYTALYNELMGYEKMRVSTDMNAFALGRRTFVRMAIMGKTLCVFLALDPKGFDPDRFHHKDKGNVRKYASTPMMMRVRSNLSLRRTLALILYMAGRYTQFKKSQEYVAEDLSDALAYRTDEELLALNLIRSNVQSVRVDLAITEADVAEQDAYVAARREYVDLRPIKQSKVGNISSGDVENMRAKISDAAKRSPQASATGKFVMDRQGNQYRFLLYAPNGDLLYVGKMYATPYAVDRAVESFREMVRAHTPFELFKCEDRYYCTVHHGGVVFKFPDYPTKILALEAQQSVTDTVVTAIYES